MAQQTGWDRLAGGWRRLLAAAFALAVAVGPMLALAQERSAPGGAAPGGAPSSGAPSGGGGGGGGFFWIVILLAIGVAIWIFMRRRRHAPGARP